MHKEVCVYEMCLFFWNDFSPLDIDSYYFSPLSMKRERKLANHMIYVWSHIYFIIILFEKWLVKVIYVYIYIMSLWKFLKMMNRVILLKKEIEVEVYRDIKTKSYNLIATYSIDLLCMS